MSPRWSVTIFALMVLGCSEGPHDSGATQAVALPSAGELAFIRCRACHTLKSGQAHKVGPNLFGFMGRRAGTAAGYHYSDELVASELVWDANTLAAWITDPAYTVPGTTMVYPNDLSGDEIVALVAYLEAQTQ